MPLDNPRSDFSAWYSEIILRAKIVDIRTPIKGSNVLMPNGYEIWEAIKNFMNMRFEETGHKNAYFPMFIPEEFLTRESEHFSGFVPEVAWVTHVGDKKLTNKVALRPTSETIMYYMYAQWIHSHADLPLKYNQWCNIIRWDTKETRPLLRDREFFWSEAHTCHPTFETAAAQVRESMEIYQSLFDALCLSYMVFKRPKHDTFPGAEYTIAYDAPLPNGKMLQIGTTHHLGNNFAKAFDVKFLDTDEETKYVYQTSYGISTRLIAAVLSLHGDDQGLILPPAFAPTQVVIVPITFKDKVEEIVQASRELAQIVRSWGYRVTVDDRDQYTPGWKYSEWEMQGVPIRLELGPRDLKNNAVMLVRRDTGDKLVVSRDDLQNQLQSNMEKISTDLKSRADETLTSITKEA
ncbi:MAG: proline--tRNA ligase, partial [Candidatus Kariarchaeaceae archaeon]